MKLDLLSESWVSRFALYVLVFSAISACGGSGGGSDDDAPAPAAGGTVDLTFGAQAQNVTFANGVTQDFVDARTFDVTASGGPFESITVDTNSLLANISAVVSRPGAPKIMQKVETIAPDTPAVGNCFPFGIGAAGNPGITAPWGPFGGFVYQNLPAFDLAVGDAIAFDLGLQNDVDIGLDIDLAATPVDGGDVPAGAFTRIVSNTQTAVNPRGDAIVGNYELEFSAENAFSFGGGGLIIRFSNPSATFAADTTCDQVLVSGDATDTSGYFVKRLLRDSDGDSPWSESLTDRIGAFRVGSGPLTTAATVEVYTGLAEEQDNLCGVSPHVQQLIVYIDALNQLDSVQPPSYTASQDVLDIYNSGSVSTCTRIMPSVNATASMSGMEADIEPCSLPPSDFSGTWSGTYSCTGSCPESGAITLTVTQDGSSASYSDGSASYSGHICGDVFSFRGGAGGYDESGKLTLTGPNSATKNSFFRASPICSGSCVDSLTR